MRELLTAVVLGAVLVAPDGLRAQVPEKFTNLQILPKTVTRAELVPIMRGFALNLGVRCEHCHVGEGNDLSKFDFASDAKPKKAVARQMLKMVASLNAQLAGIGEPAAAGTEKITCFTCHRGATKPLTSPGGGGLGLRPVQSHDRR